ncbi:MAG: hypothetical protein LBI53_04445 [Candidatus Peribacteria bacterium]|nr:hypothetical protein [Candidatus Peribacteria bacterium]
MDKQLIRLNKNTLKFSQINSFIRDYFSWKNFDLESVKKNPERTQNLEKFVHLLDTEYFSTISNLKKGD